MQDDKESVLEPKAFEYGDLVMTCSCGSEYVIQPTIKHGIQMILTTNESSKWTMKCTGCSTEMSLFFKESSEESIKLAKEKEQLKDESIQQGDTTKNDDQGIPGESELSNETNA